NTGNQIISNLSISDPLLGAAPISVTPSTLAVGEVGTATAVYTITASDIVAGQVVNTAVASGTDPDGDVITDISDSNDPSLSGSDDPTVVKLESPSITLVKSGVFNDVNGNGLAEAGETITYSFT